MFSEALTYLEEPYARLAEFGFEAPPDSERDVLFGRATAALAGDEHSQKIMAAFWAAYVSRRLSETDGGGPRLLLGDYFLSCAIQLLLPLENSALLGGISAKLEEDSRKCALYLESLDFRQYLKTVDQLCAEYMAGRVSGEEICRARIRECLDIMEAFFRERFAAKDANEMDLQIYDVLMSGGKRLRPRLLALCAGFGNISVNDTGRLMAAVEMLHTASLVHDDIVDKADTRRGRATINALKGSHYAAQSGHYLVPAALEILRDYKGRGICQIFSGTVTDMCLGELQQLRVEYDLDLQTIDDYISRIECKTARLMEACCRTGARAAGLSRDEENALGEFGRLYGLAFQLRDDLLDYEGAKEDGKPLYQDLRRGLFTLPILYALGKSDSCRALLKKRDRSEAEALEIIEWVNGEGGIDYTKETMNRYIEQAAAAISNLRDCAEKVLLRDMLEKLII